MSIVVDRNKSDGGLRECSMMMFEGEGQNCPSEGFEDVFLLYRFWDRADRNAESVTGAGVNVTLMPTSGRDRAGTGDTNR